MSGRRSGGWHRADGFTLVDVVLTLALVATVAGMAMPLAAHALDVSRARHAGHYLAAELRWVRQQAVATRRAAAIVFDRADQDWTFRRCSDGNGNGVRRADILSGEDPCATPGLLLRSRVSDVRISLSPVVMGPDDDQPGGEAVRFGTSAIASCTPTGGCSVGTVFVRSIGGTHMAVRVGGITGRTRVLRFESGAAGWVAE